MKSNRYLYLVLTTVLLIAIIAFFDLTEVDVWVSNHFYNFTTGQWILDRHNAVMKFIFYDGIKRLLSAFGAAIAISLIIFRNKAVIKSYQRGLIILLLSGMLTPSVVGSLKTLTNIPCPRQITQFHGAYPNIKVFECYPDDFAQTAKTRCWPAGHASGGFALLALFFVFKRKKNRIIGGMIGFTLGWTMGLYKMLIGDHFLSHTIITMVIAWLIALLIAQCVDRIPFLKRSEA